MAAAIAIAVLAAGCSDNGTAAESERVGDPVDPLEKASVLCDGFMAEIADLQPRLGGVSASSVGEIRQVLDDLGEDSIPEWAKHEDGDFIAICGYPLGEPDPLATPTTICPNGEVRSLSEPAQAQYLVDGSGLGVRDITQDDLPPIEPPACP